MKDTVVVPTREDRVVAGWLLVCALTVFAMVVLGGVTRLTHSGLSMVDWQPLMGVLPPLSQDEWQATFEQYKQYPEYQKINRGMDLAGFKSIFWFEYAHRVLGRAIGVVFLVPMLVLLAGKYIRRSLVPKLLGLFVLGGLQGLMGWYMVMSGLVDDPRVSQYRLTAHLALAAVIFAVMLWLAFDLLRRHKDRVGPARFVPSAYLVTGGLFLMILSGGFVAGTRAGLAFGTFPLMGDSFIPPGLYATDPFWLAAFEDVVTIQFNHRMLAYALCVLIGWFAYRVLRHQPAPRVRLGVYGLLAALAVQVCLGITTILYHVPVALAAAHQGGALVLFGCSLFVTHALKFAAAPAAEQAA